MKRLLKTMRDFLWVETGAAGIIKTVLIAGIAFLILGITLSIGGPQMIAGFDAMRTANNASQYTGFLTTVGAGPTLIVLGFIISVGIVGFMGLKLWGKKG